MPTHYTITEVEDKVIAALAEQMASYIKTCKSYQGEFDSQEEIQKLLLLSPAALVIFKGRDSKSLTPHGHAHVRTMTFTVYLVARDLRGEATARTKAESGVYAMIEDCDAALLDEKLDMDIPTPIRGGDVDIVIATKTMVVFAVRYQVDIYKV